jgi:hypothetical protein
LIIREVAGIQDLDAGVVIAIERRDVRRASNLSDSGVRIEPQSEMVHLDRVKGRVQARIGEWSVIDNDWRRS